MPSKRDRAREQGSSDGGRVDTGTEKMQEMRVLVKHLRGAAGVGHGAPGLETFLLMPDNFRRSYDELVGRALKPAVSDSTGQALEASAKLGKATDRNALKGTRIGMGGGAGKRWKTFWTVRDERALVMKGQIDRQLRKLDRMMRRAFDEWDMPPAEKKVREKDRAEEEKSIGLRCVGCGRMMDQAWRYCPACGESSD